MKYLILILTFFMFSPYSGCTSSKRYPPESFKKPLQQKDFELETLMAASSMEVAALGRIAALGDLYDARTDKFIGISLYTSRLPGDAIYSTAISQSTIKYVLTESMSEKMEKMGFSASISLSVLGVQAVEIEGSGRYLNEDKKRSKSAKISLIYSLRTVRENLNIFFKKSTKLIDRFLLRNMDATHVVTGIEWGADVVMSLEETNTESSNVKKIKGELGAAINILLVSVSGSAEAELAIGDLEKSTTFSVNLIGDIMPDKVPQTVRESMTFIRNVPQLIKKENGGKGKMMKYIMMPLVTVLNILYKTEISPIIVKEIEKGLTDEFLRIFQDIKDSELLINDIREDMSKWVFMISENESSELSNMKSQFDSFANQFRAKFADFLPQFRSGNVSKSELKDLISQYKNSKWTSQRVGKVLEDYTPTMNKIRLMDLFKQFGALFIDRRTNRYRIIADNYWEKIKIVSMNLNINAFSPFVSKVAKLLKGFKGKYYIEDRDDLKVAVVEEYYKGTVVNSFLIQEKEYVVLISENANVIIVNSESYDQIATNEIPQLTNKIVAIVGSTFYRIDTSYGEITSTAIENIIEPPKTGIYWNNVGSFPATHHHTRSTAAVNGTQFYFVTYNNILYKYDTLRKFLSECKYSHGSVHSDTKASIIVNNILYFTSNDLLYYYDGNEVKSIEKVPESIKYAGLFEMEGKVCRVGGDLADKRPYSIYCYEQDKTEWAPVGKANEARYYPAVISTRLGILIVGGIRMQSNNTSEIHLKVVELFSRQTKLCTYISRPPAMTPSKYLAAKYYSYD